MKILLATGNAHKREEIAGIVAELALPFEIVAPPGALPEVVEDGDTLLANAVKKATAIARAFGLPALADDTGLEIDALGGKPGVFSARYAGPDCDPVANVARVLAEMADVPEAERSARFRCVVALCIDPRGEPLLGEGTVEGRIHRSPRGDFGFGYDPVFLLPERGLTLAELPAEEKNRLSHRYRALADLGRRLG